MDLTSLYRMVSAEAPNIPEEMMKGAAGQAALQQADEQLMANKRLRDLYSSGKSVSPQDIMGISPELGIQMQQAQFKNMLEAGQIEKLNREKQEHESKVYAQHMSPIAQDYFDDVKKGMPEQQAEYKFRSSVGKAQADIEQRFGIKPQTDFTQFSPLQIAQRSHSLGVDIPHLKEMEEQQKSQLAIQQRQAPTYEDISPKPIWDSSRGQFINQPSRQMPDFTGASATELNALEASLKGMSEGPEKEGLKRFLAEKKGMPAAQTPTGLTPIEEVKSKEAQASREGQLKAEKEATIAQREEILSSIPKREEIETLIDKSIASGVEQQVKGKLAGMVGTSSEALEATKQLDVIAPQLKSITKSLAGAGAISDFEQKMMADAAGAIADPNVPANARKAAFRTFMDIMEKADKSGSKSSGGLQIGHEESGYRFKGGNPADKSSWEKM
jgi:hypothetical protein